MRAKCHACGREYLVARAKAGVSVRCRGCGALNDGAGGDPPAQPPPAPARKQPNVESPSGHEGILGTSFELGGAPPLPARKAPVPANATAEPALPARRRRSGGAWRVALVVAFVGAVAAALVYWRPWSMVGGGADPRASVAQLVGDRWRANGFLAEVDGRYWLVTQYDAVENLDRVDVLFRSLETGDTKVDLMGLPVERFLIGRGFIEAARRPAGSRSAGVVACDVTDHRERFERAGIRPLKIGALASVDAGEELVCYAHEIADELGEEVRHGDDAIEGMAIHAVRSGSVVRVKREDGAGTWMLTSVPYEGGMVGAPLFRSGEHVVVAISLEGEWDADLEIFKPNASVATDAAILRQVVSDGESLESVRASLERSVQLAARKSDGWSPGGEVEMDWPIFAQVDDLVARMQEEGWIYTQSLVGSCRADGVERVSLRTQGLDGGDTEVYLLAFAEEPLVDLDIEDVEMSGLRGIGSDYGIDQGGICMTPVRLPETGEPLRLARGTMIDVPLRALFAGRPIAARCSVVMLERAAGAVAAQAEATPPVATPDAGAPVPEGVSGTRPPRPSPPDSIASRASVKSMMDGELFASSIIGLTEFDNRYLRFTSESGGLERLIELTHDGSFASPSEAEDQPMGGKENVGDVVPLAMEASVVASEVIGDRPAARIEISDLPEGEPVRVYLEVDAAMNGLVLASNRRIVSSGDAVATGSTIRPPEGVFNAQTGATILALDIPWNVEGLRRLQSAVDIPYQLTIEYRDGSRDQLAGVWRINPPSEVESGYPFELGFATMVDRTHPWVRQLVAEIQNDPFVRQAGMSVVGAGGDKVDQLASLCLVWRELTLRGVRYQNLTGSAVGAQRVRQIHESLGDAAANCIDGAVLLSSIAEAIGIRSQLVLIDGHAFVLFMLEDSPDGPEYTLAVETTKLGESAPRLDASYDRPLFDAMRRRYPSLQDVESTGLEWACDEGWRGYLRAQQRTREVMPRLLSQYEQILQRGVSSDADAERLFEVIRDMRRQIKLIPIARAVQLGVRPVGAPADLPPLPSRARN